MNKMKKMKVYVGFDPRERTAYDVTRYSILSRAKNPKKVQVIPIELSNERISKILTRPIEKKDGKLWCPISQAPMATEFAISRFCVPFLENSDWVLFCDSDMLCLDDIENLFALADDKYAVMVVKHNQNPTEKTKMDGQVQTSYSRKNWSSLILWNCSHPSNKKLTKDMLNSLPGRDLHAFKWLEDEEIGELPVEWNFLVRVSERTDKPLKMLHYTLGGPWFENWEKQDMDDLWIEEARKIGKA